MKFPFFVLKAREEFRLRQGLGEQRKRRFGELVRHQTRLVFRRLSLRAGWLEVRGFVCYRVDWLLLDEFFLLLGVGSKARFLPRNLAG